MIYGLDNLFAFVLLKLETSRGAIRSGVGRVVVKDNFIKGQEYTISTGKYFYDQALILVSSSPKEKSE
jgi:hypothetical protein